MDISKPELIKTIKKDIDTADRTSELLTTEEQCIYVKVLKNLLKDLED
ncbi:hypothetical protein ACFHWD_11360 [Clostridium sp. MT-14]|jgi:hypothetical protein|nr:hypothetical protein [Clostridium luticellarii]MCI1945590.1 hypothetical protein [Clostridium luticellarii]